MVKVDLIDLKTAALQGLKLETDNLRINSVTDLQITLKTAHLETVETIGEEAQICEKTHLGDLKVQMMVVQGKDVHRVNLALHRHK
jgi:hypothetical protein